MSSTPTTLAKAVKKSAFSCDSCRRRKVKCGGEQPSCEKCLARSEACIYKLRPTLSYTERLEARVKELEEALSRSQVPSSEASTFQSSHTSRSASHDRVIPKDPDLPELLGTFEGLTLDDQGGITYHGGTSFFQLPTPGKPSPISLAPLESSKSMLPGERRKCRLVQNAWQQRALETSLETPEPFKFMLKIHWCWVQPLFNFVYRPAFTRDMESLGPYYSHTLLNAMLSHTLRWCKSDIKIRELLVPYANGDLFYHQARAVLFDELKFGQSKIPTVQALLLLSAHECSSGNRTQAWLYSGMAFRLIEDMGISIDSQKYASTGLLSDEDVEIRHRLFWSCYCWDKMISLYLGRRPTLQHSIVSPPQDILDDSAENELWIPYGINYPEGLAYPPMKAHSISYFSWLCRLSEIFNQILTHVYDPLGQNTRTEIQTCLEKEGSALRLWWEELPDYLKIDDNHLPAYCPPSHIVTLNCLYLTFKILLYRPMLFLASSGVIDQRYPSPEHLIECISSATSIIRIFSLFCQTFGHRYAVLSLGYSVYTAASIFLLQIQATPCHDGQALNRLQFCISSLELIQTYTPVIRTSLAIITEALVKLGVNMPALSPRQHSMPLAEQINTMQTDSDHLMNDGFPSSVVFDSAMISSPLPRFNIEGFSISPEMLKAFSSLKPIGATVGTLRGYDWATSSMSPLDEAQNGQS